MLLIQKLGYLRITKGCPLRMNSTLLNLFKKTAKICTNLLLTISPEKQRNKTAPLPLLTVLKLFSAKDCPAHPAPQPRK
jgi:hypothetical protein